MNTLEYQVATLALEQAREALRTLPDDASPSQRSSVVTTAVRALTAYREASSAPPVPPVPPEQEVPESPA